MIANGGINNIIFTVLFNSSSKKSLINELNIIVLTNTNAKNAKIIEIIIITIVFNCFFKYNKKTPTYHWGC